MEGIVAANKTYACMNHATTGIVARVYVAYMDKNPKYLDAPIRFGLAAAIQDSYPCPAAR